MSARAFRFLLLLAAVGPLGQRCMLEEPNFAGERIVIEPHPDDYFLLLQSPIEIRIRLSSRALNDLDVSSVQGSCVDAVANPVTCSDLVIIEPIERPARWLLTPVCSGAVRVAVGVDGFGSSFGAFNITPHSAADALVFVVRHCETFPCTEQRLPDGARTVMLPNAGMVIFGEWQGVCGSTLDYHWEARDATFKVTGNVNVNKFGGPTSQVPPSIGLSFGQRGTTVEVNVEADGRKANLFVDVAP